MYAMALLLEPAPRLGLPRSASGLSAVIVLVYIFARRAHLGDLQRGAAVLPDRARLRAAGVPRAARRRRLGGLASGCEPWRPRTATRRAPGPTPGDHGQRRSDNPMGVEWFGMVMGLGFVLSFGYWCTDFLVVQRAMAAESMSAARRTPLIAAVPKMLFPFLVILPGMIAIALTQQHGASGFSLPAKAGRHAQLRPRDPDDAGALLPVGHARPRPHRADGVVHVRHGGQRHRVQHRLDLRHLPGLHHDRKQPTPHYLWMGRAATVVGHRGSAWRPPTSRRTSTTSWTCCSWCSRS